MTKPMRFVTGNIRKIEEYTRLLEPYAFIPVRLIVREPQGDDQREIVRRKVLMAFAEKRAPLFVDHTGLSIGAWNDLPGGLTPEIWRKLGMQGFLRLMQYETNRQVTLRTIIGYCCSRRIQIFEAEIKGAVATHPDGPGDTWESLFIPEGYDKSLASLTVEERIKVTARAQAAQKFKKFLERQAVRTW